MCTDCVDKGLMTQEDLDAGKSPLEALLSQAGEPIDPEAKAKIEMDAQVSKLLTWVRDRKTGMPSAASLDSSQGVLAFSEVLAGDLMFRQEPQAIAWVATLIALRYEALLADWAALFVNSEEAEVDEASLSEDRQGAVDDRLSHADTETRGGMYP